MNWYKGLGYFLVILICSIFLALTLSSFLAVKRLGLTTYLKIQDYNSFYTAGILLAKGVREDFYNPSVQYYWQQKSIPMVYHRKELNPFRNLPFVALPFFILSFFSFPTASIFIFISNSIFVCIISKILSFSLIITKKIYHLIIPISLLAYVPVWHTIMLGQNSLVLLLSLLLSYLFYVKNQEKKLGLSLSILLIKPQYIILPLLFLLLKKRFQALKYFGIATSFYVFLSVLLVGFEGLSNWLEFTLNAFNQREAFSVDYSKMLILRSFFYEMLKNNPVYAHILWIISSVLLIILQSLFLFKKDLKVTSLQTLEMEWSLMIVLMVVTSPYANLQDLAMLIIPMFLLAKKSLRVATSPIDKKLIICILIFSYSAQVISFIDSFYFFHIGLFSSLLMLSLIIYFLYKTKKQVAR